MLRDGEPEPWRPLRRLAVEDAVGVPTRLRGVELHVPAHPVAVVELRRHRQQEGNRGIGQEIALAGQLESRGLEAARLQTFPKSFLWCGTKLQIARQIGNAVPIPLGKAIAEVLVNRV